MSDKGREASVDHLIKEIIGILRSTKVAKVVEVSSMCINDAEEPLPIILVQWPGFGTPFRQLICLFDQDIANKITEKSFLHNFQALMKDSEASIGLIVYGASISDSLRALLRGGPYKIQVTSHRELLASIASFSPYVEDWFPKNRPRNLRKYYVERRWKRLHMAAEFMNQDTGTSIGTISTYVDEWLHADRPSEQLAILSDGGTGKTWLCWHICDEQMERYKKHPMEERLPLYIRLRDYTKLYDIVAFIMAKLDEFGIQILGGYEGLRALSNRFLLVLDGFDEMETRRNQATIFRTFDEINRLITPASKVILTSRKVMFHEMDSLKLLLTPSRALPEDVLAMMHYDMGRSPRSTFDLIEIVPFNDAEIKEAVAKRQSTKSTAIIDSISEDENLADLASTPILLDRLVTLLPRLRPEDLSEGDIYETLIEEWLERPVRENRSLVRSTQTKILFAEEFAWNLAIREIDELLYTDFPWHLAQIVQDIEENPLEDPIKDDLRTQTFLETDLKGYYKFTHASFKDFFIARKLSRELSERDASNFGRLVLKGKNEGVALFLPELIKNHSILWDTIEASKVRTIHDWTHTRRHAARNAVTILSFLDRSFRNRDLSYCDLRGAILRSADLTNCDLSSANLEGADLTDALMDGVVYDKNTDFSGIKGWPERLSGLTKQLNAKIDADQVTPVSGFPHPPDNMVLVHGGKFQMGSDNPAYPDEHKPHWVEVDPFFLDIHEVTNDEFLDFVREEREWGRQETRKRLGNEYYLELWNRDSELECLPFSPKRTNHPVVYVSWFGAIAYCNWLSRRYGLPPCYPELEEWYESRKTKPLGRINKDIQCNFDADGYRLPTEAEWEFAARGGHDQLEYPWGREFDKNKVIDPKRYTAPVLLAELNEFGVSGLVGNVREWCYDWYDPDYYQHPNESCVNPQGPKREDSIRHKVVRGGTMNRGTDSHRCASRSHVYPENTNVDAGFRCVRRIPEFNLHGYHKRD